MLKYIHKIIFCDFCLIDTNFTMVGIQGLALREDFLTREEEEELIKNIDDQPWNTSLKRRTQHYGYMYDYTSKSVAKRTDPIPEWCDFVVERLCTLGVLEQKPNQMIINEYHPGQGIYPHVDDVNSFKNGIVSVSLGSSIVMDFIKNDNPREKRMMTLTPRSALSMHDQARYQWRHGITARNKDGQIPRTRRVSLTFRTLVKKDEPEEVKRVKVTKCDEEDRG